jgi:hypothetical protein
MKTNIISILLLIACTSFIIGCGASNQGSSAQKQWTHFRIDLSADENSEVKNLQYDLGINPMLSKITICVNVTDPKKQYIIVGDEKDPNSKSFKWTIIRKSAQDYLLNYMGPKKKIL